MIGSFEFMIFEIVIQIPTSIDEGRTQIPRAFPTRLG
jgi:hypothetical protein